MIDRWLLPGPAAFVSSVVADLAEGRQVLLTAKVEPPGLRRAIEASLSALHHRLRLVYDQEDDSPRSLLLRTFSDGIATANVLSSAIYWIDGVTSQRAPAWSDEAVAIAEMARNRDPRDRPQLAIPWPDGVAAPRGLDIINHRAEPLKRLDLEVAARYAIASAGEPGTTALLRAALAIELSAPLLPEFSALDALESWIAVPEGGLADLDFLAKYAVAVGLSAPAPGRLMLAMWRSQHAVLMAEIDARRIEIIERGRPPWQVPYTHPASDGRTEKRVIYPDMLELTHLCQQAKELGLRYRDPLRDRLEALRITRNALSHLDPLTKADLADLLRLRASNS